MHELVMYGLGKQKKPVLIRKWEWLQRQLEEKHKCDSACDPVLKMYRARL